MLFDAEIRAIAPSDVEGFHRALDVVARERIFLTLTEAPPLAETRAFVLNAMEKGDVRYVALFVAEVVGWCDISRLGFAAHAHRGSLGMGIVPGHRGRGLGLRLIEATLNEARRAGFVRIELDVHADNDRAIRLYKKVGFVREGRARDAACIDGRYRDAIMMAIVERQNAETAAERGAGLTTG